MWIQVKIVDTTGNGDVVWRDNIFTAEKPSEQGVAAMGKWFEKLIEQATEPTLGKLLCEEEKE